MAEVAANDVSASSLSEKHDGLIHLVVCYETAGKIKATVTQQLPSTTFLFEHHLISRKPPFTSQKIGKLETFEMYSLSSTLKWM